MQAAQLTVYQREAAGFIEVYRLTGVRARQIWPIALLVPATDSAVMYGVEWGKSPLLRNIRHRYVDGPDWPKFLTDFLGLNLSLPSRYDAAPLRATIRAALDQPGPLGEVTQGLINKYLGGSGPQPGRTQDDNALLLQLVQDRRVRLPYQSTNMVPPAEVVDATYMDALALAAWDRVRLTPELSRKFDPAGAILALRLSQSLQPYWADMVWVSEFREFGFRVPTLLERFADFGTPGAERLVFLIIDTALQPPDPNPEMVLTVEMAALVGLCRMGHETGPQRAAVAALMAQGSIPLINDRRGKLAVQMLARMGFSLEEIRAFPPHATHAFRDDQVQIEVNRADRDQVGVY